MGVGGGGTGCGGRLFDVRQSDSDAGAACCDERAVGRAGQRRGQVDGQYVGGAFGRFGFRRTGQHEAPLALDLRRQFCVIRAERHLPADRGGQQVERLAHETQRVGAGRKDHAGHARAARRDRLGQDAGPARVASGLLPVVANARGRGQLWRAPPGGHNPRLASPRRIHEAGRGQQGRGSGRHPLLGFEDHVMRKLVRSLRVVEPGGANA